MASAAARTDARSGIVSPVTATIFESLSDDQRDPKQSLRTAADLDLALAAEAKRSRSASARSEARTALQRALDGWHAYQRGAGAKEDHQREIDELSAALREADRMAAGQEPSRLDIPIRSDQALRV